MKKIHLNLAARPFKNYLPYYFFFILFLLVLLTATVFNLFIYLGSSARVSDLSEATEKQKAEISSMKKKIKELSKNIKSVDIHGLNEEVTFINSLLERRYFSWTALFNRLEELIPKHVQLVTIVPGFNENEIGLRLDCIARDPEDVYEFIQNLEDSPGFYRVYPHHEKEEVKQTFGKGISFTLSMKYIPDEEAGEEYAEQEIYLRTAV